MARSKRESDSPFTGLWHIISMDEWDEDFPIHERLVSLDAIEDTLQLHPVLAPGEMVGPTTPSLPGNLTGCICFPMLPTDYTDCTWRNGVGLCWRATRQGITRPRRVNDPQTLTASAARAASTSPPRIQLPCHASQNAPLNRQPISKFTHKFCGTAKEMKMAFYRLDVELERLLVASGTKPDNAQAVRRISEDELAVNRLGVGTNRQNDGIYFAFSIVTMVGKKG